MNLPAFLRSLTIPFFVVFILSVAVSAQTTEFTYQGSLKDGASAANGNYDFEFALFDALSGGSQLGATLPRNAVAVTNGVFSVKLDFGSQFPGANRFLEIKVRLSGQPGITILAPRQLINSAPYAVKSLTAENATQLGGMAANQFVLTSDTRLSDDRNPLPNSANYIQNTTTQQTSSNFNISGTGSADQFNAATQYNIGGNRVLSIAGSFNTFAGVGAGQANTGGVGNSFFGFEAGRFNTTALGNSFFGIYAGRFNTTGGSNSFFGYHAGYDNTSGIRNSFFGFGAGIDNTEGSENTFIGRYAGLSNTTGRTNTVVGANANVGSGNLTNAIAIGSFAYVTQNNSLVLGSINGVNTATADTNVGIGTSAPTERLDVIGNGKFSGNLTVGGTLNAALPAGSANYIQNTTSPQSSSNFNISGTGTANIFNVATQFNLGGSRVLSADAINSNLFAGTGAGGANTTGNYNAMFGADAGFSNTTGRYNSFFGGGAGYTNTTGNENSFFGLSAGALSETGNQNSFFGAFAGQFNTTGSENSFFGRTAGGGNTTGSLNTFFGRNAGGLNSIGLQNTIIGAYANVGSSNLTNAAAMGYRAVVAQSNSLVLGSINGVNAANADTNIGIGTTTPSSPLEIQRHADLSSNWQNAQLRISGRTNPTQQLNLGFDTTNNRGLIQASSNGSAFTNLLINPFGGNVGIGTYNPQGILQVSSGSPVRIIGETFTLSGSEYVDFMARNQQFNSDMGGLRIQRQSSTGDVDTLIFAGASGNAAAEKMRVGGNGNVGIGTSQPQSALHIQRDADLSNWQNSQLRISGTTQSNMQLNLGYDTTSNSGLIQAGNAFVAYTNLLLNSYGGNVGVGTSSPQDKLHVAGVIRVDLLSTGGSTPLCLNASNRISSCSSSIRYKQNINSFQTGLSLVKQLHPVTFNWRANNQSDFGLVAEEVANVEPLLVTRNDKGETEGVKYDHLGVVLVNAVNEQQLQIEAQQKQINEAQELNKKQLERLQKQQSEIEALKALVCLQNTKAEVCKQEK